MNLFALLLGITATIDPFVGLLLCLAWCGFSLNRQDRSPGKLLGQFFVAPVLVLISAAFQYRTQQELSSQLLIRGLDAVFGVGLPVLFFLIWEHKHNQPLKALANSSLVLIAYGCARYLLFGRILGQALDAAISSLGQLSPSLMSGMDMQNSLDLVKTLLPASWMLPQLAAMFLGFLIYQRMRGVRFVWREAFFPRYYNLLILLVVPLFFIPQMQNLFINSLLALCFIPAIQGIGVVLHFFSGLSSNIFMLALLIILIAFNLILVALVGFADIWLDLRKINTKGTFT